MGKMDDATNYMMENNRYFADAVNCIILKSGHHITSESLAEISSTNGTFVKSQKNRKPSYEKRMRDLRKLVKEKDENKYLVYIAGLENQTEINRIMPVRNMLYDAIDYNNQARKKVKSVDDAIKGLPDDAYILPVLTVVINFSGRKWDQPLNLHELYEPSSKDKWLMEFIPDYRINLIDPHTMSDEEIEKSDSGFREVLYAVKYSADKNKFSEVVLNSSRFENLDEYAKTFLEIYSDLEIPVNEKGGYNMCQAVREMKEDRDNAIKEMNTACKAVKEMKADRDNAIKEMNTAINEMNTACKAAREMKEDRDNAVRALNNAREVTITGMLNLIRNNGMSPEQAVEIFGVSEDMKAEYLDIISCRL